MRPTSSPSFHLSPHRFGFFGVFFVLTMMTALAHSRGTQEADSPENPQPDALQPARNPERLHLLLDATKVFGWVSGKWNHAGQTVTVRMGKHTQTLPLERGNIFSWPYRVAETKQAEFTCGLLRQTIALHPPSKFPPCVFFVVDRGVYRPNQTLRFAGFLRKLDERGEFTPLPAQSVEVLLTGERKNIIAARLKTTADAQGRILGEYTFSDADPLDGYRLSIPGYKGEARVSLAEYRKTKIHLNILGQREGSRLKVRFQARDYLDKPVNGSHVQFVAQVVRDPVRPAPAVLDAKQFAYAGADQPPVLRVEDLTAEERLLAREDAGSDLVGSLNVGREREVVAQFEGKLDLGEQGERAYPIELRKGWLQAGHALVVRGVLIDGNRREERQTKTIPLTETDDKLRLSLPRSTVLVNEPIRVTAQTTDPSGLKGSATLVAMRLSATHPPLPTGFLGTPAGFGGIGGFGNFGNLGMGGGMMGMSGFNNGMIGWQPLVMSDWSSIHRQLATAVVFRGDTATLRLTEPGAYMLTAIWHKPDGTRWHQEIGCTVLPARRLPALRLQLDRDTYESGDVLKATIRSIYADPWVLLTLRDSRGLRMWRTLRLVQGKADVQFPLAADLRYGCSVEVQYADGDKEDDPVLVASRIIHVVPTRRILHIQSEVKPILEPGEKAVLNLQVNRKEPVDLIVSVYDKALLNIAPDQSKDIKSFYLADDRIYHDHAREVLRRRLGDVTIDDLLKQARGWLKEHPDKRMTSEGMAQQTLVVDADTKQLRTPEVAELLRLAGVKTLTLDVLHNWALPEPSHLAKLTFWEWLNTGDAQGWRLHYSLVDDTLLLTAYHPAESPAPWKARAVVYYPSYMSFNGGMMGMGGFQFNFQGSANLGVGGGIVGIGGRGGMGMMGMAGMGGVGGMGGVPANRPVVIAPSERPKPRVALLPGDELGGFALQIRRDFSDSAYWNAQLRTDANGKARVEFKLPDSLTGWQVVVTAISKDLHVGRHETSFRTAKALMVTPILPRFFTEGDKVRVWAGVHNRTDASQTVRVRLKAENGKVQAPAERDITLEPKSDASVFWDFQAGDAGSAELLLSAESKAGSDASLKRLPIVRAGIEHIETVSGFCKDTATIKLPEGVDPQQVVFEVRFTPSLTADLLDTLHYLVEYPYGCVEQTMSRFLPAIKVAQVLKRMRLDDPELSRKLPGVVRAGIHRLLDLQHEDGGWGWWEKDQTHPIMTPYALYGLLEAEKAGYDVGSNAIQRGLGRLKQFIEDARYKSADRIYGMYVYGQRHPLPDNWWGFIEDQHAAGKLSDYALALSLELAVQQTRPRLAARLAGDLRGRAKESAGQVHWRTARLSHWADDPFEVTAAALKALVAYDKEDKLIPGILAYFAATKRDNRWNSTKDTATIVYALCDYLARQEFDPRGRPSVAFRCNDGPKQTVPFAQPSESRKTVVPAKQIQAGVNRLTFTECTPGMMYRVALRYWKAGRNVPPEDHGIQVRRRYWLLDAKGQRVKELQPGVEVPRGAYLESVIEAQPDDPRGGMRYVLVENPRPAGCEVVPAEDSRFDQSGTNCLLREDREKLVAYHHDETQGQIVDRCILHAEMAGEFLVPAAHVEMMYQTDVRGHSGTFHFRVAEKAVER
jgi:hypothetical protein